MTVTNAADRLLLEVFEKGHWNTHKIAPPEYVIPEETSDKIHQYLITSGLIGVQQEKPE